MLLQRMKSSALYLTVLAGGVAALLVGLADGLYSLATHQGESLGGGGVQLLLSSAALVSLMGLVVGLMEGLLAVVLPEDLSLPRLLQGLKSYIKPEPELEFIHRRTARAVSMGLTAAFLFMALYKVGLKVMLKGSGLSGALLLMLAILFVILLSGLMFRALSAGLERLLTRILKLENPKTARIILALSVATIALAYFLAILILVFSNMEILQAIPVGAVLAVAFIVAAPIPLRVFFTGLRGRARLGLALTRWPAVGAAAAIFLGLFVYTFVSFGSNKDVCFVVNQRSVLVQRLLNMVYWRLFDGDGDGHAGRLCGQDCDDGNPKVHPEANEDPRTPYDDDCDGETKVAMVAHPSQAESVQPGKARSPSLIKREVKQALPVKHSGVGKASPPGEESGAGKGSPPKLAARPNIVFILVDTLAWDHLGCYGYHRPTSPNIDRLAKESARFKYAYAQSTYTPQSMPSILSGRYPGELYRNFSHFNRYSKKNSFFPELLKSAGYRTAGVLSHFYFRRRYGLDQGFDHWDLKAVPKSWRRADLISNSDKVTDQTLKYLGRKHEGDKPFFLFLHYNDPHRQYLRHRGFRSFGNSAMDRYDHEILYTDHHVGRLIDALRHAPSWNNTVVVLTTDHGEAFGAHGYRYHGRSLYEDQIRVPLLIRIPWLPGRVYRGPASLVDLAPTLLALAGIPIPKEMKGLNLTPYLSAGKNLPPDRPILAHMPPAPLTKHIRALIRFPWKLIHYVSQRYTLLYNLEKDPDEKRNLSRRRKHRQRMQELRRELRKHFKYTMRLFSPKGRKMR